MGDATRLVQGLLAPTRIFRAKDLLFFLMDAYNRGPICFQVLYFLHKTREEEPVLGAL